MDFGSAVDGQNATVTFDPTIFSLFDPTLSPSNVVVLLTTGGNNTVPIIVNPTGSTSLANSITYALYATTGLALAAFLVLLVKDRLVAIEMMAVLQVSYLGLVMISTIPLTLLGYASIPYSNGYNQLSFDANIGNTSL